MIEELEKKIIRVMNQNARKSFREIAKEVGHLRDRGHPHREKAREPGRHQGLCPDRRSGRTSGST